MVVMLLKELRTIFTAQIAWMYILVVIFTVLFGGLGCGKLQPHCARMRMVQAELQTVVYIITFAKTRMGKV